MRGSGAYLFKINWLNNTIIKLTLVLNHAWSNCCILSFYYIYTYFMHCKPCIQILIFKSCSMMFSAYYMPHFWSPNRWLHKICLFMMIHHDCVPICWQNIAIFCITRCPKLEHSGLLILVKAWIVNDNQNQNVHCMEVDIVQLNYRVRHMLDIWML